MVKQILTSAGFEEGKTFKETRFLKPPTGTYAIYMDSFTSRGADDLNLIKEHDYTIEVYSCKPDPIKELAIENALDSRGIPFEKESRYWIQEEQLYQVIYNFTHIEK